MKMVNRKTIGLTAVVLAATMAFCVVMPALAFSHDTWQTQCTHQFTQYLNWGDTVQVYLYRYVEVWCNTGGTWRFHDNGGNFIKGGAVYQNLGSPDTYTIDASFDNSGSGSWSRWLTVISYNDYADFTSIGNICTYTAWNAGKAPNQWAGMAIYIDYKIVLYLNGNWYEQYDCGGSWTYDTSVGWLGSSCPHTGPGPY